MSKKRKKVKKSAAQSETQSGAPSPADPVDVADGIPDRSATCPLWRYAVLGAVFIAWIVFLVYCQVTAMPN